MRVLVVEDEAALADGIRRVLDDDALGEKLARAAFADAPQYSWGRRAERLEELLGTLAAGS